MELGKPHNHYQKAHQQQVEEAQLKPSPTSIYPFIRNKDMRVLIPQKKYIKDITVEQDSIKVNFASKKKVCLLFVSINEWYWPYLAQVIKDCRKNFLPQHKVDFLVWTDYNEETKKKQLLVLDTLWEAYTSSAEEQKQERVNAVLTHFTQILRLYEVFLPQILTQILQELAQSGLLLRRDGPKFWIESQRQISESDVQAFVNAMRRILTVAHAEMDESLKGAKIFETGAVQWPAPTLMRYHLFLNEEKQMEEYDYVFYMDADMRVVAKISDEILGSGLTAAEHPMYSLRKEYVPPYEPNPKSTAYIKRPGKIVPDENGNPRFKPYYYAGGFQGGTAKKFIRAMKKMKAAIDKDFYGINYTAIWNDESYWNKYLFLHPPLVVLSPSYVYPDSLIKEFYEPIWGRSYEPKIITLTKPFSLSAKGAEEINKFIQR